MSPIRAGGVLVCTLLAAACQPDSQDTEAADLVFRGGAVYTVADSGARQLGVAVSGNEITFVGSDEEVAAYIGPGTEVVELDGRLLMPGIVDAHLHPLGGAIKELYQCNFPFSATPEDVAQAISACVAAQPDADWITGGQWDSAFFDRFELPSPREFLDAVSGNAAVLLSDDSGHNAWVNTKALELAGISRETSDPAGGTIERSSDGTPNGVLLETAQGLVYAVIPKLTDEEYLRAARWFSDTANAFGITAVKAAAIEEEEIRGFRAAEDTGTLNLHVATSIRTPYGRRTEPLDYDEIDRIRETYRSDLVDTNYVKIFLDGVPTPARTAAMLDPYVENEQHGADFSGGPLHVDKELLAQDLIELERRGYTVKIHTAGDRSVRDALDAIAVARAANNDRDKRHELSHAGYIADDDLPRFAELNVVADLSPVIWHPSPIIDAVIAAVGKERGERYWPVRDLLDSNAPVLAGSDWPSAVPDANPWVGIEAFVTRRHPSGKAEGALWPEQAVTLKEALDIYTIAGARAMRLDHRTGSVEPGKLAHLIVLDRNLFDIPIEDVGETEVDMTFFAGQLVYEKNPAAE